ncbi:hypothetical protein B0H12DRAFT_1075215 [Mycena haematopus]|nr:hypothetical protein B0H12DRAFT_1075215 [Mycena haematopus]
MAVEIPQKLGRKGEGKDNTIVRAGNRPRRLHRPRANRKSEMRTAERNMESDLNQEFEAIYGRKNTAKIRAERRGEGASNSASRRPAESAEAAARDPEIGNAKFKAGNARCGIQEGGMKSDFKSGLWPDNGRKNRARDGAEGEGGGDTIVRVAAAEAAGKRLGKPGNGVRREMRMQRCYGVYECLWPEEQDPKTEEQKPGSPDPGGPEEEAGKAREWAVKPGCPNNWTRSVPKGTRGVPEGTRGQAMTFGKSADAERSPSGAEIRNRPCSLWVCTPNTLIEWNGKGMSAEPTINGSYVVGTRYPRTRTYSESDKITFEPKWAREPGESGPAEAAEAAGEGAHKEHRKEGLGTAEHPEMPTK